MPRSRKPIKITPATDEEIEAVLKESGVESLDETPPGTLVFHGWGEYFAGHMSDLIDQVESAPERDRLRVQAQTNGRRIEAAFEREAGEGRKRAVDDAVDAHLEFVQDVVGKLEAQQRKGHG